MASCSICCYDIGGIPRERQPKSWFEMIRGFWRAACSRRRNVIPSLWRLPLGVVVGPAAMQTQWDEALVKARRQVADMRMQGQSMAARVYLYNAYAASLYLYNVHFVDVPAAVLCAYSSDMERITRAPWQAINTQM